MSDQILMELEAVRSANPEGKLKAQAVVDYARDESTALHSHFTWDDAAAAEKCRRAEARKIIEVMVRQHPELGQPIRVYVSLKADRKEEGGGYRPLVDVMSHKESRERFLREAMEEMEIFEHKYAGLRELEPIFAAKRRVKITMEKLVGAQG